MAGLFEDSRSVSGAYIAISMTVAGGPPVNDALSITSG
jgi:hypothetical protein